jgi:HD superfamily phosphohydrolase
MAKQKQQQLGDPLTDEQARALLTSVSVIRDPVHGDIRLTMLERLLVDSAEFQRLRHIQQLAMVDLVYPGAVHNRFLHSLGTLHVCSEMILACNNATKMYAPPIVPTGDPIPVRIGHYAEFLARLTALLHDLAHVPFGHVFDKEIGMFEYDEWEDPWRVKKIFGADSDIRKRIRTFFKEFFCSQSDPELKIDEFEAQNKADVVLDEIRTNLQAKLKGEKNEDDSEILSLRYPFVHDIVGNTICADLIDYVQRDMYFCGLTEGIGKRFIQYLAILPTKFTVGSDGKKNSRLKPFPVKELNPIAKPREQEKDSVSVCRLVILNYRYNSQGSPVVKHNILAEVIDLVRRRKTVAEKLYFHKTKLVATSMLATAVYAGGIRGAEALWEKSDSEVLKEIAALSLENKKEATPLFTGLAGRISPEQRKALQASRLASKLLYRHLFKPIYRTSFHVECGDDHSNRLWHNEDGAYVRYNSPQKRAKFIEQIEEAIRFHNRGNPQDGIGAVSISCPDKHMQLKEFNMLVLFSPNDIEIRQLEETERPIVKKEIEVIQAGHQELWCLEVFVDPDVISLKEPFARQLAGAIQHEIGLPNEIEEVAGGEVIPMVDLISTLLVDLVIDEKNLGDEISRDKRRTLFEVVSRDSKKDARQAIIDELKSMGFLKE